MESDLLPVNIIEAVTSQMTFNVKTIRIFRIVRLVRIIRLLKGLAKYERVQAMTQIADTLIQCLQQMGRTLGRASHISHFSALAMLPALHRVEKASTDGEQHLRGGELRSASWRT